MGIEKAYAKTGKEGEKLAKIRGQFLAAVRPTFFHFASEVGDRVKICARGSR